MGKLLYSNMKILIIIKNLLKLVIFFGLWAFYYYLYFKYIGGDTPPPTPPATGKNT